MSTTQELAFFLLVLSSFGHFRSYSSVLGSSHLLGELGQSTDTHFSMTVLPGSHPILPPLPKIPFLLIPARENHSERVPALPST